MSEKIDKEEVFSQLKEQKTKNPPAYNRIMCPNKPCPVYLNIRNHPLDYYRAIIQKHVQKKHGD